MQVKDIMTKPVEVLDPEATLREAALRMKELDVGLIPACDGDRLVGMLSDRDIAIRAVAEGRDPDETRVRDAMTPEIAYIFADQDVEEAARVMHERQVRRLPVLNRDKRLVGIVSLGDVAVRTRLTATAGEALQGVSEPSHPTR